MRRVASYTIVAKRLDGWRRHLVWKYRHRRRPHCIRRVPIAPRKGHSTSPSFRPMSIVAAVAHLIYCWALVLNRNRKTPVLVFRFFYKYLLCNLINRHHILLFIGTGSQSNACSFVWCTLQPARRYKAMRKGGVSCMGCFHVLLVLGRAFVFGLRTLKPKELKTLKT